jgi:hypothetical protein
MNKSVILLALLVTSLFFSFTVLELNEIPSPPERVNPKESNNIVSTIKNIDTRAFVKDVQLYSQKWHELPQPQFWRRIMKLPADHCLVNVANTRQILTEIPGNYYMKKNRYGRDAFKDSIKVAHSLPNNAPIYITSGKSHYYKLENTLEAIPTAVNIFKSLDTDPWYAQAILLIESPNKLQKSPTGAYGPFQLMRGIARMYGLEVNRYKDDRRYLDKSSTAAAKFIKTVCIPETEKILHKWNIDYQQQDLWFRLLVLHVYHAGAGNVNSAVSVMQPKEGGQEFIKTLWQTESRGFRNASQNYSQIALAALLELDQLLQPYKPLHIEPLPPVFIGKE